MYRLDGISTSIYPQKISTLLSSMMHVVLIVKNLLTTPCCKENMVLSSNGSQQTGKCLNMLLYHTLTNRSQECDLRTLLSHSMPGSSCIDCSFICNQRDMS